MAHPFYRNLSRKVQQKITVNEAPAYIRIQSDRNQVSGITHDYYLNVIMQLSHVTATPVLHAFHRKGDRGHGAALACPAHESPGGDTAQN